MIQLQAINNILNTGDLESYLNAGIDKRYFYDYDSEFNFINSHYINYGKVPDLATFLARFSDFEVVDVLEPTKYIIENLKEEYLYTKGVEVFTKNARLLEQNSYEGLQNIIVQAEKLLQGTVTSEGHDINDMINERIEDINSKRDKDGLLGISTGLPEIDKILGGWLPGEEFVVIVGRVNQGKSWLLQKFLTEAHNQSKKILHYSGEMGVLQVAYRHDTLGMNYSNRQLMRATISDADYEKYEEDLQKRQTELEPYIVVTPRDLGGKYLTTSMLRTLIKKYKPDIVGIDQLSLMDDERRGENKRIRLTNISADLYSLSEEFQIPILADAQANRNKADIDEPENPDLADIGESDGIGQNATRVISLVQTKAGLSLFIPKNRYGENNKKLIYAWDIDQGTFSYVTNEHTEHKQINTELPLQNTRRKSHENSSATDVF